MWTDAHCHLADPRLDAELDGVLARSRRRGVTGWIQGGVGPEDWQRQRTLAARVGPALRLCYGLHPWWVAKHDDDEIEGALRLLEEQLPDAVAVGELGLDLAPRWAESRERQKRVFERQLELANRVRLPVVLHVVRAHREALDCLAGVGDLPAGGIVHAFAGEVSDGLEYVERGLHLSIGGRQLGSDKWLRRFGQLPVERIVVETDSPDQKPPGVETSYNEPANLPAIAAALAPAWGMSGPELLDHSTHTLHRLFPPSRPTSR